MSERGVFAMDRGWFDHPVFADEPYTEREAWAWLIAEAAWKARTCRAGKFVVELKRGQVCASVRHLAKVWRWDRSKIERFLKRLKNRDMIETQANDGISVITICNYNKYQRVSMPAETLSETRTETAPRQHRDNNKDIKDIKEDADDSARARDERPPDDEQQPRALISQEAIQLAQEIAAIAGYPDLQAWPPGWCGSAMRVEAMLGRGWKRDVMLITARNVMARSKVVPRTIGYFEAAFADAHAAADRPLPAATILPMPNRRTANGHSRSRPTMGDVLLQLQADADALRASEIPGAGEAPDRLLPPG
jgi:DNA-binding transcriptional regulator YhcF (GntR family)